MKGALTILWPSFLVAAAAEGVFFSLFDPAELHVFGSPIAVSDLGAYTIGFFCFWAIGAGSSWVTWVLKSAERQTGS